MRKVSKDSVKMTYQGGLANRGGISLVIDLRVRVCCSVSGKCDSCSWDGSSKGQIYEVSCMSIGRELI